MLGDRAPELGGTARACRAAGGLRVEAILDRSHRAAPPAGRSRFRANGSKPKSAKRRPAPEGERLVEESRCLLGAAGLESRARLADQVGEPLRVHLSRLGSKHVARRLRDDQPPRPVRSVRLECPPQTRDVRLQGVRRGNGRATRPELQSACRTRRSRSRGSRGSRAARAAWHRRAGRSPRPRRRRMDRASADDAYLLLLRALVKPGSQSIARRGQCRASAV